MDNNYFLLKKRKKRMIKQFSIALYSVISFFLFFSSALAANKTVNSRPLEINYPQVPGTGFTPKTVSTSLPNYVKYIFDFSIFIIGIIILGAIIYSGAEYFSSVGDPGKLKKAKNGLISAFIGAIILLSSVLLFNTINPALTVLTPIKPNDISSVVIPGVYLCDYKIKEDINSLIDQYINGKTAKEVNTAAKKIKSLMQTKDGNCSLMQYSHNLGAHAFSQGNTSFVIPQKITITKQDQTTITKVYDYGIILHEKDNFKGKCQLLYFYSPKKELIGSNFSLARSVTVFKKPSPSITNNKKDKGVTFFQCIKYNTDVGLCPGTYSKVQPPKSSTSKNPLVNALFSSPKSYSYKTPRGEKHIFNNALTSDYKTDDVRSLEISPPGAYFTIFSDKEDLQGDKCKVFSRNDDNIMSYSIGRCGLGCHWYIKAILGTLSKCVPCTKSIMVISGQVL